MHILIVDDHALIREALTYGLRAAGHDVAQAKDGKDALSAIAARMPDVLITDLEMPGMNGVELIEQARRSYPDLAIVAMSARASGDGLTLSAVKALDRRCKLQKPFSAAQLIGAIAHARLEAAA